MALGPFARELLRSRGWMRRIGLHSRQLIIPSDIDNPMEPTKTVQEVVKELTESVVGTNTHFDPNALRKERVALAKMVPSSQDEMPPRRMTDSFDHAVIPLSKDFKLRDRYITTLGGIRLGRLLEDMDVFSVHLVFKHLLNPLQDDNFASPFSVVTALVDRIDISGPPLAADRDIKISGHITWVGKSSAEVTLVLHQRSPEVGWEAITDATFVMAVRNSLSGGPGVINPLIIETPEENRYYTQGMLHKEERVKLKGDSLFGHPPAKEEISLIHEFFTKTVDHKALTFKARIKPPNSIWMEDGKLKTVILCQPQHRNRFDKIFGGFIMRQACELAWTNTYVFSGLKPSFMHIDDILFKDPVNLGSVLYFSSQICFTTRNHIQTRVSAEIMNPQTKEVKLTNVFHYTLRVGENVPEIIPKTYHEAMLYLDSRRHYLKSISGQH